MCVTCNRSLLRQPSLQQVLRDLVDEGGDWEPSIFQLARAERPLPDEVEGNDQPVLVILVIEGEPEKDEELAKDESELSEVDDDLPQMIVDLDPEDILRLHQINPRRGRRNIPVTEHTRLSEVY